MGIKGLIAKAGGKAADGVSKLSSLSPEQLQKVQSQRDEYLSQMPNPNDSTAEELTKRLLAASSVEIYKAYLAQLKELYVPIKREVQYGTDFDTARNIRFFNITKWVVDKSENSLEKLVNVYEVLSNEDCNISLVFHRTCEKTNVYLAVTNTKNANNNVASENFKMRLGDAIKGNFPGSEWAKETGTGVLPCMQNDIPYSVAIASNIPTEKSEKFISQTIEKLLDGIIPDKRSKEYIIILLATPIRDIEYRKLSLAEMYSGLAPYASWTTTFTYNEQNSTGSAATVGVNIGASAGIQNGQNQANTMTSGTTDSNSNTVTDSTNDATTESAGETVTDSTGQSITDSTGQSVTDTTGRTESSSMAHTEGENTAHTKSSGSSDTVGAGVQVGGSTTAEASLGISGTEVQIVLDRFGAAKWERLTDSAKVEAIQELATVIGKKLRIEEKPEIQFYSDRDGSCGAYVPGDNKVEINRNIMNDPKEVIDTVAHEMRHAYQHQRAGLQETWQDMLYKINFENYISPIPLADGKYLFFTDYQDQLVEAEARAFANIFTDKEVA